MKLWLPALALAAAPILFQPAHAQACSMAEDYAYPLKNELIQEFLNHESIRATVDHVVWLRVTNYKAGLSYTFNDSGIDCPDTTTLTARISAVFARPVRYNSEKAALIQKQIDAKKITPEKAAKKMDKLEVCHAVADIESVKKPTEEQKNPLTYSTNLKTVSAIRCAP